MLSQLAQFESPGQLEYWNGMATNYPNISPGVGLRDYADITPFQDMPVILEYSDERRAPKTAETERFAAMEQVAREFMSLILLYARTMGDKLNHRDDALVEQVTEDVTLLARGVFLPCPEPG